MTPRTWNANKELAQYHDATTDGTCCAR